MRTRPPPPHVRRCRFRRSRSTRRGRFRSRLFIAAAVALTFALSTFGRAHAEHVQVRDVAAERAEFSHDGNHFQITADDGTVINYDRFDVPVKHLVEFVQPDEISRVLNRIQSETPSHIDGTLTADDIVYFANPAGVVFGPDAVVDVGQFHATRRPHGEAEDRYRGGSLLPRPPRHASS